MVDEFFEQAGPVDVLVNNAGVAWSTPLRRTTLEDWRAHRRQRRRGVPLHPRGDRRHDRAVAEMAHRDVASVAGLVGSRYTAAAASKHAAIGLMRAAAAEAAGTGVTANAVCPAGGHGHDPPNRRQHRRGDRPSLRGGRGLDREDDAARPPAHPLKVAFAVEFRRTQAGAINGQTLVLDGGGIQS